jgi:hypothetical protein
VDKKLFEQIIQLTMNYPSVNLVKENFVALEQYPGEHRLNHWISGGATSV